MKYLILTLILTLLCSCAIFRDKRANTKMQRYKCVKNLVEIKIPSSEAISFCNKNFQDYLEE